jgi:hypothetical protein
MQNSRGKTGNSTRVNWNALQTIALQYLKDVCLKSPGQSSQDILKKLDLPPTQLFFDLARQAGFSDNPPASPELTCAIAALFVRGIVSEQAIAKELSVSPELVLSVLESHKNMYGSAPYGAGSFGCREYSNGNKIVPRQVTMSGQMSYRGENYTLGASYRGRRAMVREKGNHIFVAFVDRPSLCLHRRKRSDVNAAR